MSVSQENTDVPSQFILMSPGELDRAEFSVISEFANFSLAVSKLKHPVVSGIS